MPFQVYPKILALGKEETDGILNGICVLQEKIDGANTQIWLEDGKICCGSRNHPVEGGFNGFYDYVQKNAEIARFFQKYPNYRLYGEWLIRHSLSYNETSYKKFYAFDIEADGELLPIEQTLAILADFTIEQPQTYFIGENPSNEEIEAFLGKSTLGPTAEGIVIKNANYVNKFGNKVYAKIVRQEFKEANAIIFGGNSRYSEAYWETYIMNKYMDVPRIEKIIHKIESLTGERPELSWTPRVSNTAYHDLLTEEIWEIAKKAGRIDFPVLKRLLVKKAEVVFKQIIAGDLSIALTHGKDSAIPEGDSMPSGNS